jgi:uncharacterized membrane protein
MYTWSAPEGRAIIMPICSSCGTDVAGVKFCSKCGQPVEGASDSAEAGATGSNPAPTASPLEASLSGDNKVLGPVAYITIIPAIVFLLIEPYNKNHFIRFHSLQCLLLAAAGISLSIANMILSTGLAFIPVVGWLVSLLLSLAVTGGLFIAWLIAVIKAFNGEEFRLPIIGDIAAKHA